MQHVWQADEKQMLSMQLYYWRKCRKVSYLVPAENRMKTGERERAQFILTEAFSTSRMLLVSWRSIGFLWRLDRSLFHCRNTWPCCWSTSVRIRYNWWICADEMFEGESLVYSLEYLSSYHVPKRSSDHGRRSGNVCPTIETCGVNWKTTSVGNCKHNS